MPHIHEHIDFTVTPIIIHPDKDKVLLVYHPRYKQWLSIGGHVELDEDPDEALLREIKEESGLEVEVLSDKPDISAPTHKPLWRPRFIDIHEANPPHRHVGLVYFCLAKSKDFSISDEHEQMKWFTISEMEKLDSDISDVMIYYAETALKEVKSDR